MKKLIIFIIISFIARDSFCQGLQKGNLLGLHEITVKLNPNVSMEQFTAFYVNHVIPEYEKAWTGLKGYLVKSFSSKHQNSFAIIWLFDSEAARNKYFTTDGKSNALELANRKKVQPIEAELKKYGAYTASYKETDDWVVE